MSTQNQATESQASFTLPPVLEFQDEDRGREKEKWKRWKKRWEAFTVVTKLTSQSKQHQTACLTYALSDEVQDVVENLPYEQESDKDDIKKIITLLEQHYAGETNEIFESYKFFQRDQHEEETLTEYVAALRKLAATCNFGDLKERLIRDRIVCGIRNKALQAALLEDGKLTLKKCVDKCKAAERTGTQMSVMKSREHCREGASGKTLINLARLNSSAMKHCDKPANVSASAPMQTRTNPSKKSGRAQWGSCRYCGEVHRPRECPAYGKMPAMWFAQSLCSGVYDTAATLHQTSPRRDCTPSIYMR